MRDVPLRLTWVERPDGFWNAECPCGATLAGVWKGSRSMAEVLHATSDAEEIRRLNGRLQRTGEDLSVALSYIDRLAPADACASQGRLFVEETCRAHGRAYPGCVACAARGFVAQVRSR